MNYFTYELWNKINSPDKKTREEAHKKWLENIGLYKEKFKKVEEHLSKDFLKKFRKYGGFHDFIFKSIQIEQNLNSAPKVSIVISLNDETCEIIYKGVDKIGIQYANDRNILGLGKGFDTIGYNEFSINDNQIISHELLFSSGATIFIEFKRVCIKKLRV